MLLNEDAAMVSRKRIEEKEVIFLIPNGVFVRFEVIIKSEEHALKAIGVTSLGFYKPLCK